MANVLKKLIRESSLLAPDFPSFKRQESIFIVLNLFVLAVLILIHTLFSSFFGAPPRLLLVVLAAGFLINVVEVIWVQGAQALSAQARIECRCSRTRVHEYCGGGAAARGSVRRSSAWIRSVSSRIWKGLDT